MKTQRCIWHLLKNIDKVLEERYPHQKERGEELMTTVRGIITAPLYQEARRRFRALALKDSSLARYLWPQIKKGIEYLGSREKGGSFYHLQDGESHKGVSKENQTDGWFQE